MSKLRKAGWAGSPLSPGSPGATNSITASISAACSAHVSAACLPSKHSRRLALQPASVRRGRGRMARLCAGTRLKWWRSPARRW
jgi:hypothetical protein